jgi:hypothetical protein
MKMTDRSLVPGAVPPGVPDGPDVGRWPDPRDIGADLARQVRDCLADLPWYPISPVLRHWHRSWGATPAEVRALDNFARPSIRRIVPELQDLHVGQWLSMVPKPSERTAFRLDSYVAPSWLLWRTPNRSWAWRLTSLPGGRTRLVTRMHTVYEWRRPLVPITVVLMECADYPMMRRMLRGIRDRAEARVRPAGPAICD